MNDNLFKAGIRAVANEIEKQHGKVCERIEMFFDYRKDELSWFFKFENSNEKFGQTPVKISQEKDANRISEMLISKVKKRLQWKELQYVDIVFNAEKNKEDVLKLEIFYIDGMNTQRHFDSKKPDSYNFTNEN